MALPSSLSLSLSSLPGGTGGEKKAHEGGKSRLGDRVCAVAGPLDVAGAVIVESDEFLAALVYTYISGGRSVRPGS